MQDIQFVFSRDVSEESDSVITTLKDYARYRRTFDLDYARMLVKRFGLDEKKPINKLSVGMQAMLNVIEGLAGNAEIIIFDEVHHGPDGAKTMATMESIIQTANLWDHDMYSYVDYLLKQMTLIRDVEVHEIDYSNYLPWNLSPELRDEMAVNTITIESVR